MGSVPAELKLVQLRTCFANIPLSLKHALDNANAVVQNVIVELQVPTPSNGQSKPSDGSRSIYVGWAGEATRPQQSAGAGRTNKRKKDGNNIVELDTTFGRTLGLLDGQKVNVLLHLDPPLAHTVHVEPLAPADWEVIESRASFLENYLLSQVRALPNPNASPNASHEGQHGHPITIHLSPTSTANIIVTSLTPSQRSAVPFVKLATDSEVIVAPKLRSRPNLHGRTTSRSVASKKSISARNARQRSRKEPEVSAVFMRPIDRALCQGYFDGTEDAVQDKHQLYGFVDREILEHPAFRGSGWVVASLIKPAITEAPLDSHQQQRLRDAEESDAGLPTSKVVAKLLAWETAPDSHHAVLSSPLCAALAATNICGGVLRLSAAPESISQSDAGILKLFPLTKGQQDADGLRIGGQHGVDQRVGPRLIDDGVFSGNPITNGQFIGRIQNAGWPGGIARFQTQSSKGARESANPISWRFSPGLSQNINIQAGIPTPIGFDEETGSENNYLLPKTPSLVGVGDMITQITIQLTHGSSVLLTGGLGSGKSSVSRLIAHRLRSDRFFHTTYCCCRDLVSAESRVATIKETIARLLANAAWGTKLGGKSLIILDHLDKLCPAETELQTTDNERSRHTSEVLCSLIREYCSGCTNITILATAQNRDSLHSLIIGANIVKEIIPLVVPDKDVRRNILNALTKDAEPGGIAKGKPSDDLQDGDEDEDAAWMGGASQTQPDGERDGFDIDPTLDMLDIAGQTDGYLPGDLSLLVSRAKNEAIIRAVEESPSHAEPSLTLADFQKALKGFTPASLRNVTLQTSRTTFGSIGGLYDTRKILLETLQYPTTYAPIFAQCPLRLRSGLLLYGYPGCGKTLLASAVAGECGLNFISVKGPEILNKYIGASEKSVRDLFERAESARPCVLFFDEFDSIAPKRGHDSTGVTDRVVNQLLTQMDGAEGLTGVYVLAATSRPDLIDPALLRPGRLDKSLLCDIPNYDDRLDIIQALAKKLEISPRVLSQKSSSRNLAEIARRTEGYSGADLQAVVYNAHLEAIHDTIGDQNNTTGTNGRKGKESKKRGQSTKPNILQFRFGQNEEEAGNTRAQEVAEYAAIIAKLDALKIAKKKEKQARRGLDPAYNRQANGAAEAEIKVIIEWKHIEASLASTRRSISAEERRKFELIYREFVVGRNGEMPDGEASNEIGGRTSLM